MKKVLLALLAAAAILAACTPKEVLPSSIQLNKTTISLVEGENFTLQALVNPSDAANKEVTWSSSADVVATVDQTGKVVALKEGTATITATSKAASSVKGTCEVTVTKKPIPVTAVQIAEEPDRMVP
ncbi:MAG: Ig domain-containing protein, partial [Bacteroidales bacterium]|nr:Ig domain-containing protein [Bacteroidales bacterium]